MSNSVRPHRRQPTRPRRPWDSPGKNTGVGCHFLLQCMKVKSESEVAQSCPTLSDPMDCSLPGSSVHGIFQPGVLEWGAIAFSNYSVNLKKKKKKFLQMQNNKIVINIYILYRYRYLLSNPCQQSEGESVAQSCLTLCNPMDCSPPDSSAHGILQARILEWVAISFNTEIRAKDVYRFIRIFFQT